MSRLDPSRNRVALSLSLSKLTPQGLVPPFPRAPELAIQVNDELG